MRLLWHSSSPECRTGYGIVTREIVQRLIGGGHFVRVGCKHDYLKFETRADGLEIFEGSDVYLVNQMLDRENFDFIFTLWDIWILDGKRQFPSKKWIAYVPINTMEMPAPYARVLKNTYMQIAQSRHGERVMREAGFEPVYAPHGVDTKAYYPDLEARRAFRAEVGWTDENFVIGLVGINYADDTKGVIPLLLAFKEFHKTHPQARLLLCTLANERDVVSQSINYHAVVKVLGLEAIVAWPDQSDYFYTRLRDEDMRRIYNGMDVFCLPSRGESFGLPILESQACGVPVIVPDKTSGPELVGPGWLIEVDMFDDSIWTPAGVWRYYPRPSRILAKLNEAYEAWQSPTWPQIKEGSVANAAQYDWDVIWPKYWESIIGQLERVKNHWKPS